MQLVSGVPCAALGLHVGLEAVDLLRECGALLFRRLLGGEELDLHRAQQIGPLICLRPDQVFQALLDLGHLDFPIISFLHERARLFLGNCPQGRFGLVQGVLEVVLEEVHLLVQCLRLLPKLWGGVRGLLIELYGDQFLKESRVGDAALQLVLDRGDLSLHLVTETDHFGIHVFLNLGGLDLAACLKSFHGTGEGSLEGLNIQRHGLDVVARLHLERLVLVLPTQQDAIDLPFQFPLLCRCGVLKILAPAVQPSNLRSDFGPHNFLVQLHVRAELLDFAPRAAGRLIEKTADVRLGCLCPLGLRDDLGFGQSAHRDRVLVHFGDALLKALDPRLHCSETFRRRLHIYAKSACGVNGLPDFAQDFARPRRFLQR